METTSDTPSSKETFKKHLDDPPPPPYSPSKKSFKAPVLEFTPAFKDNGTHYLPNPPRVRRKKEKLVQDQMREEFGMKKEKNASKRLFNEKKRAFSSKMSDEADDLLNLEEDLEEQEDEILAAQSYHGLHALWPLTHSGANLNLTPETMKDFVRADKWFPRQHLFYNHNVVFITRHEPMIPPEHNDMWMKRKVIMRAFIGAFDLSPPAEMRLREIAGVRYDPASRVLKLTANERHTQAANKAFLKVQLREILHEAWKADPNYISARQELPPAPRPVFVPSEVAQNAAGKPFLFKLRGFVTQQSELPTKNYIADLVSNIGKPMPQYTHKERQALLHGDTPIA